MFQSLIKTLIKKHKQRIKYYLKNIAQFVIILIIYSKRDKQCIINRFRINKLNFDVSIPKYMQMNFFLNSNFELPKEFTKTAKIITVTQFVFEHLSIQLKYDCINIEQ